MTINERDPSGAHRAFPGKIQSPRFEPEEWIKVEEELPRTDTFERARERKRKLREAESTRCARPVTLSEVWNNIRGIKPSQINGANGEWTGTDDLKKVLGDKKFQKQLLRALAQVAIGKDNYRVAAQTVKVAKQITRKAKNVKIPRQMPRPSMKLSPQVMKYLISILEPFSARAQGAYVPNAGVSMSYKTTNFGRANWVTNSVGGSWIAVAPCAASNTNAIWVASNSAAAGSIVAPTAGNANAIYGYPFTNAPFNWSTLVSYSPGTTIETRCVSASIRLYYNGTQLNAGGTTYALCDLNNNSLVGNTQADFSSEMYCEIGDLIYGRCTEIVDVPVNAHEVDFSAYEDLNTLRGYPFSGGASWTDPTSSGTTQGGTTSCGVPTFGIFIASAAAGVQMYAEVVCHMEYTGPGVPASLMTENRSDIVGLNTVRDLVARAQRAAASDRNKSFGSTLRAMCASAGISIPKGDLK